MSILRRQSPKTILLEVAFALLILLAFWFTGGRRMLTRQEPAEPAQPSALTRAGGIPGAVVVQNCQQLVANGDFEQAGGWTIPLTPQPGIYTDERAFTGQRSLRLGIPASGSNTRSDSTAYQWITLPADAESITLQAQVWRTLHPATSQEQDFQYLWITAGSHTRIVFQEARDASGWETVTFDLSEFRGQRIRILFGVFNDGGAGKAAMYVDTVSVEACTAGGEQGQAEHAIYMPLISRQQPPPTATPESPPPATLTPSPTPPPASPTPSPTPQAPAVTCQELLVNGDFETDQGWIMPLTQRPARYSTAQVLAGQRSLRLGIPPELSNANSDSTAYQWITLPGDANRITLQGWVWRASTGADSDFHYLWISSGGRLHQVFKGRSDRRIWERVEYDLTSLRGRRVRVLLGAFNDGVGGKAVMYADNFSVLACPEDATPPTPTPSPTPGNHAPTASMTSPDYGAQAFLWWRPEIALRDLMLMQEAGFRWVRQSFAWETIEGAGKGQFDWGNADRVVQAVNDRGLNLLARLGMDPDLDSFWAGHPPGNGDDFADFVFALASRYNCTPEAVGCIQAYQVWNEPNLAREWGGNRPNPGEYVAFLGKAYQAIKRANPNAIVISAGMAPTGDDNAIAMPDDKFYEEMYRAMGGNSDGYFDMLGVHGAGFAAPPELDPAQAAADPKYGGYRFFAFRHVEDIRNIMVRNGDGDKRVVLLEFGWTSDPVNPSYKWHGADAGIDQFVQADYLKRAYEYAEANWQPWIGLMSLITMPNLDWLNDGNPEDEEQYWWAIMEPSPVDELHLRPAFVSLCIYFNGKQGQPCPYDPNR